MALENNSCWRKRMRASYFVLDFLERDVCLARNNPLQTTAKFCVTVWVCRIVFGRCRKISPQVGNFVWRRDVQRGSPTKYQRKFCGFGNRGEFRISRRSFHHSWWFMVRFKMGNLNGIKCSAINKLINDVDKNILLPPLSQELTR